MTPDYAAADEAFERMANIRVRGRTHYYTDRRNFCPHCAAEHLGPLPPLPEPVTTAKRLAWVTAGIIVGLGWGFALWGIIA